MKKKQKKPLTGKDIYACNDFKEKRIKCGMGQKEWAETIGISLGLVKGIEGHVRRCTPGTEEKVKKYMGQFHTSPDIPDTRSLEERILHDVFLDHMGMMGKKEAAYYADTCITEICKILSWADKSGTKNEQKLYFQNLAIFLNMLTLASHESTSAITDSLDVLVIAKRLHSDFVKQLAKNYKTARETSVPKKEEAEKQLSLFDDIDNT